MFQWRQRGCAKQQLIEEVLQLPEQASPTGKVSCKKLLYQISLSLVTKSYIKACICGKFKQARHW